MKYLLLSIFVMLSAPPLQASFCDMCADQGDSHQSMSDVDMHAGSDSDMNHNGGNMSHDSDDQNMDCCDTESASNDGSTVSENACGSMAHCGAGSASMAVFSFDLANVWLNPNKDQIQALSQVPPHQFSSPPFRPPIS